MSQFDPKHSSSDVAVAVVLLMMIIIIADNTDGDVVANSAGNRMG